MQTAAPVSPQSCPVRSDLLHFSFIFDGETPTTKHCKYNKISFLLECLEDLDTQFWYFGGKLNLVEGDPQEVIMVLSKHFKIESLCFDQDCEAIWLDRDNSIKNLETDLKNSARTTHDRDDKFEECMGSFAKDARDQCSILQV